MKETIRCCISCILPCGALDVIRIVHANGRVEEISHAVRAGDITQAYPKHVLRKPPSPASVDDDSTAAAPRRAIVLPPTAELQRGKIYFLMPISNATSAAAKTEKAAARETRRRELGESNGGAAGVAEDQRRVMESSERGPSEMVKERVSTSQRERRRGRVGVWRPHLESISEMMSHDL